MMTTHSTAPIASVIIPTYNHAHFIGEAIQSVLSQEFQKTEIIVVDDGSTDNTREIVDQFANRVFYIWQTNQGLSAARNTGLQTARGEFIGLLDADDMYEPQFLSTLISILKANPEADGIYCGYRFVNNLNKPLYQCEARSIYPDQLYKTLLGGNFLVPESMLVRHHCYKRVGLFDISLRACEDWEMWLRITKNQRIISTDKILTRHRVLPGSMSSNPERMLNNRLAVLNKHLNPKLIKPTQLTAIERWAFGHAYLTTATEYLQIHDKDKAYDCLANMACIYPELLRELETFYELGCGDQLKGSRGDFANLDLQTNAKVLLDMLDKNLRKSSSFSRA